MMKRVEVCFLNFRKFYEDTPGGTQTGKVRNFRNKKGQAVPSSAMVLQKYDTGRRSRCVTVCGMCDWNIDDDNDLLTYISPYFFAIGLKSLKELSLNYGAHPCSLLQIFAGRGDMIGSRLLWPYDMRTTIVYVPCIHRCCMDMRYIYFNLF